MGETENDGFGNWCPDCGEPRGVCRCTDEPYEPTAFDADIASLEFDEMEDLLTCPTCEAVDVQWVGGDNVVNLSGPLFTRVDFFTCNACGHKWTISD